MKKNLLLLLCFIISILIFSNHMSFADDKVLKMSTTTSTRSSGLLDILLPEFLKDTGIQVKVIAKGTGAAIRDGIDGNVDIIFVHAKNREEKFVSDGYGTKRYAVMHNDFVILGPNSDPANIKGSSDVVGALKKIAAQKAIFVSRGDDSGTHTKEQELWRKSQIPLITGNFKILKDGKEKTITTRYPLQNEKKWYISIGQGMGKTVTYTEQKQAYVLCDRGIFIKFKYGRKSGLDLDVVCEGDSLLSNPYGIIPVNPKKHPHVKYELAKTFAEWIVSKKGQSIINNYKLIGNQLFYPDAIK